MIVTMRLIKSILFLTVMVNTCECLKLGKILQKLNDEYEKTRKMLSSESLKVAIVGDEKKVDKRIECLKTIKMPTDEEIFTKIPAKLVEKHYLRLNFNRIVLEAFNKELQNGFILLNKLPTNDRKIKLKNIQNRILRNLEKQIKHLSKKQKTLKNSFKINGLDIALTEQEALRLKIKLQFMEVNKEPECTNEIARLRQFFNNLRYFYEDFISDGKVRITQCLM